jgi:hypothetical protein
VVRRVYLSVPYEEKDVAKERGALWDPERKVRVRVCSACTNFPARAIKFRPSLSFVACVRACVYVCVYIQRWFYSGPASKLELFEAWLGLSDPVASFEDEQEEQERQLYADGMVPRCE